MSILKQLYRGLSQMLSKGVLASDSGQAIMETAIFMPVIVLFIMGIIDYGRYAQFETVLTSSARAGAEYGTVSSANETNTAGMKQVATNNAPSIPGVSATAKTYYKCDNGLPPTPAHLTTNKQSLLNCLLAPPLLTYVSVTVTGTFKPLFYSALGIPASQTVTMQGVI